MSKSRIGSVLSACAVYGVTFPYYTPLQEFTLAPISRILQNQDDAAAFGQELGSFLKGKDYEMLMVQVAVRCMGSNRPTPPVAKHCFRLPLQWQLR